MRSLATAFAIVLLVGCSSPELKTAGQAKTTEFPATTLRGYGAVSGTLETYPEGSILKIGCADAAKAKLTLAKYLSDLDLLPGVTKAKLMTHKGEIPTRGLDGQGAIAALRSGDAVAILAAASAPALGRLYAERLSGDREDWVFQPELEVPMWLDRWDKFGFRCYYSRPYLTPDAKTAATYDFAQEFAAAEKLDRMGLLFWNPPLEADTAEGLMQGDTLTWALDMAAKHQLPVGMNVVYGHLTWQANRHRAGTEMKMPQYCGDRFGPACDFDGGQGAASWCDDKFRDEMMRQLQASIKRLSKYPNIISWFDPNCEYQDELLLDYGPAADASFRQFLKDRYGSLAALRQRWADVTSWDEVKVPELASFAGWNKDAFDLAGDWRMGFQPPCKDVKQQPGPPAEWVKPGFDDSAWPVLQAPGHDKTMFLKKDDPNTPTWSRHRAQQAVYRRTFDLPAGWLDGKQKVWLYVWDFSMRWYGHVSAYVNGSLAGDQMVKHGREHWGAFEVTGLLKDGANQVALGLPDGSLAYKVYLSATPPAQYPFFGERLNAEWIDLTEWNAASRLRFAGRSAEMIRQVDPEREIIFFDSPILRSGIKKLCEKYGGELHNTGYMGGFWSDDMAMQARSSNLPISAELGEPAWDLDNLKYKIGLYSTEGLQGFDYFMHIGDILWREPILRHLQENLKIVGLIGKHHCPKAEVALLFQHNRYNYGIWDADLNQNVPGGYWSWNVGNLIMPEFDRDGVTDQDFADGNAAKYKVIIDTNTAIMDEKLVGEIEKYVRDGGVFVTFVQTGRHSTTQPDTWPISRLTGYRVTGVDKYNADGSMDTRRGLVPAPGQDVFPVAQWRLPPGNGLQLAKVAPDCVDLLRWSDGSVAVGMRPLGKGYIVNVGAKFVHDNILRGDSNLMAKMFIRLLDHFQVARVPATVKGVDNASFATTVPGGVPPPEKHAKPMMFRHYLSNNGLYDVWALWNSTKNSETVELSLDKPAPWAIEVKTGKKIPIETLRKLEFAPLETKCFLTPRADLAAAPADWFVLQRDWWRGGAELEMETLEPFKAKLAFDLTDDWDFKPLDGSAKAGRMRLGVWSLPNRQDVKHAVFRKEFTVPDAWDAGEVKLWLMDQANMPNANRGKVFADKGRVSLDGKELRGFGVEGIHGDAVGGCLKPGSKHTLEVEIVGAGSMVGYKGSCWLSYWPKPEASIDLSGAWAASDDVLHYDKTLQLPGKWDAYSAKRKVAIPATFKDKQIYLHVEFGDDGPMGVYINGHWLRRSGHIYGNGFDLNLTPWVRFGAENELELQYVNDSRSPGKFDITQVRLDIFDNDSL